jgi:raffinose/stachyose/melibiose transport system permease protein
MRDIPSELFESMLVDGAGDWRILWALVLPLTRPALATVGIYAALNVWNGFLFPLVLTESANTRVLPLSLWTYQGQYTTNIPAVLAAVVLSALPLVAVYIVGRRQLISGLTAGFGK